MERVGPTHYNHRDTKNTEIAQRRSSDEGTTRHSTICASCQLRRTILVSISRPFTMTFNLLLGKSLSWTTLFFVLVVLAVLTQHSVSQSVQYVVRGSVKAAPAAFLAVVSWYLQASPLLTLAFLLCACGDVLLDLARAGFSRAFEAGAAIFAVALICLLFAFLGKPLDGWPLLPLALSNVILALFTCLWVLPKIKGARRAPAVAYLLVLVVSNVVASTSAVPVFLGSTLWLLSDLAIGLGRHIPGSPANGMTNLGLYDLGLYFIALGLLI